MSFELGSDFELLWWWMLAAAPLPWLLSLWARPSANAQRLASLDVPFLSRVEQAMGASSSNLVPRWRAPRWRQLALALIWLLLVFAAARPVAYSEPINLERSGRDLLLAVDVSGSMETQDMAIGGANVSRLEAVKQVLNEFIERRAGDRVGLILFGTQAYVQAPLTFDNVTVRQFLNEASIGIAGDKTAIGDAIGLSLKRLSADSEDRVLILLTDGVNTAGVVDPLEAAGWAQDNDLKIYTIGFGADSMLVQSLFGSRRVNPSNELDEALLRSIAESTGGAYFRARSTEELEQIYSQLDELERRSDQDAFYRPQRPLHPYPLGAALALLLALATARAFSASNNG